MEFGIITLLLVPQTPRAAELSASSWFGSPILIYRMAGSGASREGMIFSHYGRLVVAYPDCGTGARRTFCELRPLGWPCGFGLRKGGSLLIHACRTEEEPTLCKNHKG